MHVTAWGNQKRICWSIKDPSFSELFWNSNCCLEKTPTEGDHIKETKLVQTWQCITTY